MRILLLGGGGREHALAWRLAQDPSVETVIVAPGNPGMNFASQHDASIKIRCTGVEPLLNNVHDLISAERIDFVVIGPEKYLFEGYTDQIENLGVPVFGPSQEASFLESSKIRSKELMRDACIPTADFEVARTFDQALELLKNDRWSDGVVLKLSGPAAGKGVFVCADRSEAEQVLNQMKAQPPAGSEEGLLLEELLYGEEVSLFYLCDGERSLFLGSACDHKRLLDQDQGPNTGGMGTFSPDGKIPSSDLEAVESRFITPTLQAMKNRGSPFRGVLFLGLILSKRGPMCLEYNVRFGDPETQSLLPRIEGAFAETLYAYARGETPKRPFRLSADTTLHVVKSAKGYPGLFGEKIESGKRITESQPHREPDAVWFFSGVKKSGDLLVTSGGRVCGVTTRGASLAEARARAYHAIEDVHFENAHYRTDIGAPR